MKKVLTMTLNPCIDKTIYMETFQVGGTNIVRKTVEEAAGKGSAAYRVGIGTLCKWQFERV